MFVSRGGGTKRTGEESTSMKGKGKRRDRRTERLLIKFDGEKKGRGKEKG